MLIEETLKINIWYYLYACTETDTMSVSAQPGKLSWFLFVSMCGSTKKFQR